MGVLPCSFQWLSQVWAPGQKIVPFAESGMQNGEPVGLIETSAVG